MANFRNFFKILSDKITAKKYLGLLPGNLPVSAQKWGSSDFLNALDISLYTNKAIGKRADKVGEIEFQLKDKRGNEIENDPTIELLCRPNKVFTGRQFWSLYQKYFDAVGEVYIWLERGAEFGSTKKVNGLHLLNPLQVKPFFNDDGSVSKYEYQTGNKTVTYQANEVLYIHNPDPKTPLRGQSLLKAAVNAIQTETQISTYHSRILENGGKIEGVFKFNTGPLTKDQLEGLKDQYKKEYSSAKKAGMPLFLGGNADYVRTGLTPSELSFLEAKKMTLEDICIATGVPKSMLASTNDVKFDNADADRAIFLRETIVPLLKTLTTALDYALFPDDRLLGFIDPTPENIDQKLKETESGVKNYYMTINEARERHGLDPITGGDDILVPFNLMTLGSDPTATDTTKRLKTEDAIEHPLRDPEVRRLYWGMQIKRMDAREKRFKKTLKEYLDGQEKRVKDALAPKQLRYFRKAQIDDLFKIELEVKIGKEMFIPIISKLLEEAGIDAMELAGSKFNFNLTSEINSWITGKTEIFLQKINETTLGTLKEQFEEALAQGEGREALINRIQDTYGNINKARGALIARTEVHNATQYGTMQGYKQGGLNTKIWVAVLDGATRDSHASVDGEERPLDRPFSNGLMFPGDPKGPPEEVINCRCVI